MNEKKRDRLLRPSSEYEEVSLKSLANKTEDDSPTWARRISHRSIAIVIVIVFVTAYLRPRTENFSRLVDSAHSLSLEGRAAYILEDHPLIDGHNDLLIAVREKYDNRIYARNFTGPFTDGTFPLHVDLKRMSSGGYTGAFWSAFYLCPADIHDFSDAAYEPIVRATLQQIDLYHRIAASYPSSFPKHPTPNPSSAIDHFKSNHLISPLAIEGLHQIGNSLSTLRLYHSLGVRYATLTWNCHNRYADAAVLTYIHNDTSLAAEPYWGGLSGAGRDVVREMNRLGMLVDLAHVSVDTMRDVLTGQHDHNAPHSDVPVDTSAARIDGEAYINANGRWTGSLAPPIISHSSAYALCPHPRNIPDDILPLIKARNSIVMINFNPDFISCTAPPESSPSRSLPTPHKANATLERVVEHIMHIGEAIGYSHVGIGSDFDGIEEVPRGLEDVSQMPALVLELLKKGLTEEEVVGVIGGNVLRVWREAERVSQDLRDQGMRPIEDERVGFPGVGLGRGGKGGNGGGHDDDHDH